MDLNRITAFARVVEDGSFTRAAATLGLPKSSVSRSVALLEEELGARLLQRSSRKVTLTEVGADYYARVGRALAAIEEANTATAEERVVLRGGIRVAVPPSDAGADLFMPLIARFVAEHPHIHVEVSVSARHVDLAGEGFDFAIRAGFVRDPSLIARRIATSRFALYASPSYVARRGAPLTPRDLEAHDCVLFHAERRRAKWTLTNGERTESVEVTGRINVDALAEVRSAARAGAGIGVLVAPIIGADLEVGALVRVLPDWYGSPTPLSIVYPSARFVPHRVALLRDFLLAELTKLDWSCHEGAPSAQRSDFGGRPAPRAPAPKKQRRRGGRR